ncbi:DUF6143 family protein [Paenibacillus pasadenensis]|uniref:DUF6143 family protein n=1 Tax=Paenibacillus pasadenensis TaxID=217090 RepID=UPI00203EA79D|nr:DUF6143 family protein [Paenibacillus pasadenensis]MCM3749853.1 DUF6143 family protein [Paenibacillus pasadenensis]
MKLKKSSLKNSVRLPKVVSIPNELYQSLQGRYFIGQTETLTAGQGANAWGGLINPANSGVNLFLATFTVNNLSNKTFPAKFYVNTTPPGVASTSTLVSPANTTRPTKPKVKLKFVRSTRGVPSGGTNIFTREVPPSPILVDEQGKIIIPPGGSFVVFLPASSSTIKARIVLGWYEQPVNKNLN